MFTLIQNGYVIDPASKREGVFDILINEEKISKVGRISIEEVNKEAMVKGESVRVINAAGKYVMPGFIDLHVHFREPGFEYKETIKTGSMAAAAGGYTSVCPMPNTKPVTDSAEVVQFILNKAKQEAKINIFPVGAVTIGQAGKELADIAGMKEVGAAAISEDGKTVMDSALYLKGMKQAAQCNIPVFAHCEDKFLVGNGVMNAGKRAEKLNLEGISNTVEDVITARDILLSKEAGVRLHLCHVSTKDSANMIALAKKEGLPVTGEVCPHHFCLSEEDIPSDDADYKMNPPLRSAEDMEALRLALKENILDVIATDHAPHSIDEKSKSMADAPFGIIGLETAFALTYTELVKNGYLTLGQMVEKMSVNPAKILDIERGCISEGWIADLVIADPNTEYQIDKNQFFSKGKNTPFQGRTVSGRVELTMVSGVIVFELHS